MCTNETQKFLKAVLKVMVQVYNGTMCHGVAPKDAIEQRIEHCMKKVGSWR